MSEPPREITGVVTRMIVGYVQEHAGEAGVAELLRRAGETRTPRELSDELRWSSYAQMRHLLRAANEVFDDPRAAYQVGASLTVQGVGRASQLFLRALGSPGVVYREIGRAEAKVTMVSSTKVEAIGRNDACLVTSMHEGYQADPLYWDWVAGGLSSLTTVFGLPPAKVRATPDGAGPATCRWDISWSRRPSRRRGALRQQLQVQATENAVLREQIEDLQSTAADLVSPEDIDAVLASIVKRLTHAVQAHQSVLAIRLSEDDEPLVSADGLSGEAARELAADLLAGRVEETPGRLVVDVASARRRYGRILAAAPGRQQFWTGERQLLQVYARLSASALDAAAALQEVRRRESTASGLLRLAESLALGGTQDDTAARLAAFVPQLTGAPQGLTFRWEGGTLRLVASHGQDPEEEARLAALQVTPADTPEMEHLLRGAEPKVYEADTPDPFVRATMGSFGSARVAVAPLTGNGQLLGAVIANWPAGTAPPVPDADLPQRLRGLAQQGAMALQNARLVEQMRRQALHDALTGLPNRLLFREQVQQALERAARAGTLVAVLFIDLDDFKVINDSLGHEAGDALLVGVAERVRAGLRPADLPCRLGGDEFAVLLSDLTERAQVPEVARRLLRALAEPLPLGERLVPVHASIGIAVSGNGSGTAETLLRDADAAMYSAKAGGKGRYVVFGAALSGGGCATMGT
jgi:diguanylate cyclase (GGDEF)-like protein